MVEGRERALNQFRITGMVPASDPVELREVTQENFDDVIGLQVAPDQRDFLNSNVEAVAWAYVYAACVPLAIYSGETAVGLATYNYLPADGRCWIGHLMVDERFQRRGIGRAALAQLLDRMTETSGGASLLVTVGPENTAAIALYEAFGFADTGRRQNDEIVLRRQGDEPERG